MRLNKVEFYAMNNPFRRFFQKQVEMKWLKSAGLSIQNNRVLEIGCGSGYGAVLLSELEPKNYIGIDLMPEQIELAKKRELDGYDFMQMDATDLSCFPDESRDIIVVFGILHHIEKWREVIEECYRVLSPNGKLYIEELDGRSVRVFDTIMRMKHPKGAFFTLDDFETHIRNAGFELERRRYLGFIGVYCATKKSESSDTKGSKVIQ